MNTDRKELLYTTLQETGIALSLFDLSDRAGLEVDEAQIALHALSAEGRVVLTKKGKYALPEVVGLRAAKASALRNGAPTAHPLDGGDPLRIHPRGKLRCLPDDLILVRMRSSDECELASIVQRGRSQLPAFIHVEQRQARLPKSKHRRHGAGTAEKRRLLTATACDRRISCPILVQDGDLPVRNDEIALLAIDRYPEGDRPMEAHVLKVLGDKSDMRARLKVIAESHGFPTDTPEVHSAFAPLSEADLRGREDLRDLTLFTIDGPFSKDFDDAVSLDRTQDGDWRLGVHIADVSHYVRPGTDLDRRARERGTSLYLPGLTVPMLPEELSNDLCSLMPDVDRLALSLFMVIREGKVVDHHLAPSVIHSRARLTYDNVNRLYEGDESAIPEFLHATLRDMRILSEQIRRRRFDRGCIDLDLPEAEFALDEANNPTDIFAAPRGIAERLIEDFMLAANEAVARLARDTQTPLIYRVHEQPDPDRLHELEGFLSNLNVRVRLGAEPHPGELQQILSLTEDHPSADSIRRMLLRSMQRACYSASPLGHYALAMRDYCHFTSPIRRYPDLIVHRMMKRLLDGAPAGNSGQMEELARECSAREQEATLAEREADDLMKTRYMADHIGEVFDGVISSVTGWGAYVTLENTVEGLVHIASLDDYYEWDRNRNQLVATGSRHVLRLGDRVRVRVERAGIDRGEIDFTLLAGGTEEAAPAPQP